jgi:hypothetical protein
MLHCVRPRPAVDERLPRRWRRSYREIAYPKLKNLRTAANIVCWYAVICTGVITVFAMMIIPLERHCGVRQ